MTHASALSPAAREAALATLSATVADGELDVLVVGGGIVGAGIALDAATRAAGDRPGRAARPRLRHQLAQQPADPRRAALPGDVRLRAGAGGPQGAGLLLTRLAPHLVFPLPFLYPLHHTWQRPYIGAGLLLYDGMAMAGKYDMGLPRHGHLFRKGVARIAPDLRTEELKGAIRYYDAQVDDARLVLAVARTAASHGAQVATRTRVVGFLREGERVVGVRAVDLESGRELEVRAKVVVNAAGVWTDEIQEMIGGRGALNVQASKGIHLVVPRDRIRSEAGLIARTETSVLFVIPWGAHWIIGTTDTDWNLDKAHPAASRADIDYLLTHVNTLLREPLDHDDVVGVYAGLRPLVRGAREPTSRISREHTVVAPVPGLVMIAGGKLTTYRLMAKDAIDVAVPDARDMHHRPHPSRRRGWLPRPDQPACAALPTRRRQRGLHRPPARSLRRAGRRGARAAGRPTRAGPAARGRGGVPGRRGRVRRHPRGRASPRRRPHATYAHLDRDLRPRHPCGRAGRPADGR